MCEGIRIAHVASVDGLVAVFRHSETIAETERPRERESHVAVLVDICSYFLLVFLRFVFAQHRVYVGIFLVVVKVVVIVVGAFLFFFLFAYKVFPHFVPSSACEESEEGGHLLVVEGVREVLAHALETSETSVAPLGGVAHYDLAVFVEFVGVGFKARSHREGVAWREAQTNVGGKWTPRLIVCGQIVRH